MPGSPLEVDPAREEQELRDYLAEDFELESLQNYQATLDREAEAIGDEQRLYRTSRAYLYNLTVFAMTGTKTPYLRALAAHLPAGARVLDYGCGIGSDGLLLAEAGYRVEFADFNNPSTEYLRWRLERRGIEAPVHDLDRSVPGGFDAAFAFDVIEHVDDPVAFLGEMESRAQLVMVNFLEPEPEDQALHHELPVEELVDRAADGRLTYYGIHHGRSHLVLYTARRASGARRLKQRAAVRLARARYARG
ncbi:MAG: class I SAM-dependent methyltransferase [Actinomycetota bacterium]|nr:class I SAM-dependent methyltransferase [Actinomycetota bacterium]